MGLGEGGTSCRWRRAPRGVAKREASRCCRSSYVASMTGAHRARVCVRASACAYNHITLIMISMPLMCFCLIIPPAPLSQSPCYMALISEVWTESHNRWSRSSRPRSRPIIIIVAIKIMGPGFQEKKNIIVCRRLSQQHTGWAAETATALASQIPQVILHRAIYRISRSQRSQRFWANGK